MITTEKELYTVLKDEANQISNYLDFLMTERKRLKEHNLVLNLEEMHDLEVRQIQELLPFSKEHRDNGKSFVVVTNAVTIEEVPDELITVPTLGEAEDLIQMEEIERDLGF